MDQIKSLPSTRIEDVVIPTFSAYAPLITANSDTICSVPKQTHAYGPNARQKLDVYTAVPSSPSTSPPRILIFFYGGGLVAGSRTQGFPPFQNLVYANVASFFALNHGFTVVIPDYRLVGAADHGVVKFPSGGEDVALAVEWVSRNVDGEIYILGNSAGGIHASTYLFHETFEAARAKVLAAKRLKGVVLLGVPFSFQSPEGKRKDILETYYGKGVDDLKNKAPLGLLVSASGSGSKAPDLSRAGVRVLVLNSELDPEDVCLAPRDAFVDTWKHLMGQACHEAGSGTLDVDMIPGHNHISPMLGLGTGIDKEEAWGVKLAEWLRK